MRFSLISLLSLFSFSAFSQVSYNSYSSNDKEFVFIENFDNNSRNWWTGDNSDAYGAVLDGKYILEWRGKTPIWYSFNNTTFDVSKDFEIEASIRQLTGNYDNLYGLLFNKSNSGECGFIINARNGSVVYQDIANESRTFIKDGGITVPGIAISANDYNKLTIRKIKGEYFFYINDVFLKSGLVKDFNSTSIGFQIWYNSRISIDYLKVSYLYKRPEYQPVEYINKTDKLIAKSDVDENVPVVAKVNPDRFALIIGNEDYASKQKEINTEVNVEFAKNDATSFKEYAIKVLGIPEQNITLLLDATLGEMSQGIDKIGKIIKATDGTAEVFFYYAGHGLPDEITKEAYLIPVDVNGTNLSYAVNLNSVYKKLTEYPSRRITVILDACFSGGARNQGLLSARGVKVKPKDEVLKGNLVVFTASTGEQSSLPYKAKNHGLFTYFLLKKLQETNGNLTYKELSDYIIKTVKLNSILINDKEQYPQTNTSQDIQNDWMSWRFN